MSDFMLELTDRFEERLAFDITYGTTDFDDGDMRLIRSGKIAVETALDFVCDVRDDLNRASAKITTAFFLENRPVYFSGCDVGIFGQALVDESFIVSEIEVGFSAVIGNENFSVLDRVHGTRIDVDVRIEFLHGNFVAAGFQKTSQGCGSDSLSETGNNTASDEDVFYRHR